MRPGTGRRPGKTTVSVVLPEDFYRELKMMAALEESSLSGFMEGLLRMGLREYERRKGKGLSPEKLEEIVGLVEYEGDAVRDAEDIYE